MTVDIHPEVGVGLGLATGPPEQSARPSPTHDVCPTSDSCTPRITLVATESDVPTSPPDAQQCNARGRARHDVA